MKPPNWLVAMADESRLRAPGRRWRRAGPAGRLTPAAAGSVGLLAPSHAEQDAHRVPRPHQQMIGSEGDGGRAEADDGGLGPGIPIERQQDEGDGDPEAKLQQMQQVNAHLAQQHQLLEKALRDATQVIQTKQVEQQGKLEITKCFFE